MYGYGYGGGYGGGCIAVSHVHDNPGYYTCDCVPPGDGCFGDGCVETPECPDMDGEAISAVGSGGDAGQTGPFWMRWYSSGGPVDPQTDCCACRGGCVDAALWKDSGGQTCTDYMNQNICNGYGFTEGNEYRRDDMMMNSPHENCCGCGRGVTQHGWKQQCFDEPGWYNREGTCDTYRENGWCVGGEMKDEGTTKQGWEYDYPESKCCGCGWASGCSDTPGWSHPENGMTCQDYLANGYCTGYGFLSSTPEDMKGEAMSKCCGCGKAPWTMPCMDMPGWDNGKGMTCRDYKEMGYCYGTSLAMEWMGTYGGPENNNPNEWCCACGGGCQEDMSWTDPEGLTCADYSMNGYCNGYGFNEGYGMYSGPARNYPEMNCCLCGKGNFPAPPSCWEDPGAEQACNDLSTCDGGYGGYTGTRGSIRSWLLEWHGEYAVRED